MEPDSTALRRQFDALRLGWEYGMKTLALVAKIDSRANSVHCHWSAAAPEGQMQMIRRRRPVQRRIDAPCKHTYTGREALH
jgi:hypothetical protein